MQLRLCLVFRKVVKIRSKEMAGEGKIRGGTFERALDSDLLVRYGARIRINYGQFFYAPENILRSLCLNQKSSYSS